MFSLASRIMELCSYLWPFDLASQQVEKIPWMRRQAIVAGFHIHLSGVRDRQVTKETHTVMFYLFHEFNRLYNRSLNCLSTHCVVQWLPSSALSWLPWDPGLSSCIAVWCHWNSSEYHRILIRMSCQSRKLWTQQGTYLESFVWMILPCHGEHCTILKRGYFHHFNTDYIILALLHLVVRIRNF